jgi:hypothetical protein
VGHLENVPTSPAHSHFHVILLWGDQSKSLRVLIDSLADESFLDATLASDLNIPTQPLSILMTLERWTGTL